MSLGSWNTAVTACAHHEWFASGVTTRAPTTEAINATELALDWFEAHPKADANLVLPVT